MLKNREKTGALLLACIVLTALLSVGMRGADGMRLVTEAIRDTCLSWYAPYLLYAQEGWTEKEAEPFAQLVPLLCYLTEREAAAVYGESAPPEKAIEIEDEETLQLAVERENENAAQHGEGTQEEPESVPEAAQEQPAEQKQPDSTTTLQEFVPAAAKSVTYLKEQLSDASFVKTQFYTEDATTYISPEQLNIDTLLGFDATLKQDETQPQILIYHTHSQEGYADSDPNDASTTIMGVGEYLSAILRTQYGYNVLHHMGQYDVESRDYAYSNAAEGLEQVLADNPSIEVMIDLHRDEMPDDVRLVTTLQGRTTAKFMFFNGLSYTRERGAITSLPNPYIQDNLSFSFQLKLTAEEYYPGLTRKSYLKGYRYNLQYRAKSLLIELGAQTNTVEEAMNACPPLAHILDLVLRGGADLP